MIIGLFLLLIVGALGVGVVAIARKSSGSKGGAPGDARRLVVFGLLFVLVVIAAIGVSGLLGRLFDAGSQLVGSNVSELARSLAFTLIAGPLAGLLWWFLWRGIDDEEERSSGSWSLYVSVTSTMALIIASATLLTAAGDLIDGGTGPYTFSAGLVWAGVWWWHRWMGAHPDKGPLHLTDLAPVAGATYGLFLMVAGGVFALGSLLGAALERLAGANTIGDPWSNSMFQALIWALGGAIAWWWHWIHDDARGLDTVLANTALVLAGVVGAGVLALAGAATVVFTLLSLVFDPGNTVTQTIEALPAALSSLAVGGLAWAYHRRIVQRRSQTTREAATLAMSGVGLVAAASGIGVIVNSILDAMTADLAGSSTGRALLLGGISALIVGGPVWWVAWQPTVRVTDPERVRSPARRIYLVAVFGIAAVVALVTLLVIGYRIFEFVLDDNLSGGSLIDRTRAPFGLLVATGLVAGYHYPVWKRDRDAVAAAPRQDTIGHVILVTGSDPDPLKSAISASTGAAVTVWMRSDVDGIGPAPEQLADALVGVTGKRVMVVTGPGTRVEVIPLRG